MYIILCSYQKDSTELVSQAQDCDKSPCGPRLEGSTRNCFYFCFPVHGSCFACFTGDSKRVKMGACSQCGQCMVSYIEEGLPTDAFEGLGDEVKQ